MSDPVESIPLRRSPTDLVSLLTGTIETLQEQARTLDVTLGIDAKPGLERVNVDPEKIAWAVATLVGNAFRYVRRGTRRLPGGSIRVRLRAEEDRVAVSVEDDGPGIPPDKVAKLFLRGHGVAHGTGLALMLMQDIVAAHGGTIEVKSQCEAFACGTTVTLRLPTSATGPAAPRA